MRFKGSRSFLRMASSWFFATWSKAPFISRNRAVVFSFRFDSTSLVRSRAMSIADLQSLPPIWLR